MDRLIQCGRHVALFALTCGLAISGSAERGFAFENSRPMLLHPTAFDPSRSIGVSPAVSDVERMLNRIGQASDSGRPIVFGHHMAPASFQQPARANDPAFGDDTRLSVDPASLESYGEAPQDNSLLFLRSQSVLLAPGGSQFDYGLTYTYFENDFPAIVAPNVAVEGRLRQRLLMTPLELRVGLRERTQGFLSVPIGWANSEVALNGVDTFSNTFGVGDVRLGLSHLLRDGCGYDPQVIGTLAMTTPTGSATFPNQLLTPGSNLGEGFWALSGDLLFVHTLDPVVIYYGFGYNHRFDRSFGATQVNPGEQFNYQFGLGFAVNDRVTLSTTFSGSYYTEFESNGVRAAGSILEPMRLRFAATISDCDRLIEPYVTVGMTDDAPSASFGVVWTKR